MPEYDVDLTATLFLSFRVKAGSAEEAAEKAKRSYEETADAEAIGHAWDLGYISRVTETSLAAIESLDDKELARVKGNLDSDGLSEYDAPTYPWHQTEADKRPIAANAYKEYRRTQKAEMADWHPDFDMTGVSISDADREAGSPKPGDKIARNPANHADRWLVAAAYFAANFEPIA